MLPAMEAFANRFGKKGLTNLREGFNPQTSVREFWRILKDLRKGEGKDTFVSLRNGVKPENLGFFKRLRETFSYAWHRFRTGAKNAFKREQQAVTEAPQNATMPTLDDIAAQPRALTTGPAKPASKMMSTLGQQFGVSDDVVRKIEANRGNVQALNQRATELEDMARSATTPEARQALKEALDDLATQQHKVREEIFGEGMKDIRNILDKPNGENTLHVLLAQIFKDRETLGGRILTRPDFALLRSNIESLSFPSSGGGGTTFRI